MSRLNRGLFTSQRGDWKTPRALYQALDAEFCFDYDPCPVKPKIDGLENDWGNVNFVNPPYGKEISKGIQGKPERKNRGVSFAKPNGYLLVARVCYESNGNQIYPGKAQI